MTNTVKDPRKEYTAALPGVLRNRAAVKGERTVKAGGTMYLKPLASMCTNTQYVDNLPVVSYSVSLTPDGQAAYNKYLAHAYFYAATQRTVDGLVGLIFSKEPVSELPPQVEYLEDNVDGKGTSLRDLAKAASKEAFISDRSGFLVARPSTPLGASQADVEKNNLRPKILHYKFESIINWDYEVINNIEKLSLLVLKESSTKRTGFKVETEAKYRVLELINGVYHQSLYNKDGNIVDKAEPVVINGATSDTIPFFEIDPEQDDGSVINGLVDANFQHYNLYADYGSKLHYSSFVIYTETGAQPGTNLLMGNGVKWNNQSPDASFEVLQPDGNMDGHRIALQDMELRMAALGAEQLRPRSSGAESAEAKGLDQVAQNSTTADVAITVSQELTKAINFASKWMGGSEDAVYNLNTDYNPTGMDHNMITAQLNLVQSGKLTDEQFYSNLQKGEIASASVDFEESQAKMVTQETGM